AAARRCCRRRCLPRPGAVPPGAWSAQSPGSAPPRPPRRRGAAATAAPPAQHREAGCRRAWSGSASRCVTWLSFLVAARGSRAEERRVNGVSHFMEHMLFKGTARRPDAVTIAAEIEGAGGVLNAYTSKELTCYWNQVPYEMLSVAMDVSADMVQRSLLAQV